MADQRQKRSPPSALIHKSRSRFDFTRQRIICCLPKLNWNSHSGVHAARTTDKKSAQLVLVCHTRGREAPYSSTREKKKKKKKGGVGIHCEAKHIAATQAGGWAVGGGRRCPQAPPPAVSESGGLGI